MSHKHHNNNPFKNADIDETIEDTIGLENLSNGLREVAILRKNNPQASLSELINKSETPLTKSGLNYKLNKIVEISKNL